MSIGKLGNLGIVYGALLCCMIGLDPTTALIAAAMIIETLKGA